MSTLKSLLRFAGGCIALAVMGAAVLVLRYGSFETAAARLAGNEVVLSPPQVNVGAIAGQNKVDAYFTVKNLTERTITLVASHGFCKC